MRGGPDRGTSQKVLRDDLFPLEAFPESPGERTEGPGGEDQLTREVRPFKTF